MALLRPSATVFVLLIGLVGCDFLVRLGEDLKLSADSASLGVGESVQLMVRQKASWFSTTPLLDPARTTYTTTSESALIVEPDGRVTCVGTYGRPQESAWVSATNGQRHGHLSFELSPLGPGPTLDFMVESTDLPLVPDNARSPFVPCCSPPLALREGQQMRFKVRDRASGRELTSSTAGTRYTLFFGSGVPNDMHPSIVTGGPDTLSARSFLLNDEEGVITAPSSLGRLNYGRVIVFFRNRDRVGWRPVVVVHR